MFNKEYSQEINRKYQNAAEEITRLARRPLVFGEAQAKAFVMGLKHLERMPVDEFKKLQKLSVSEIKKMMLDAEKEEDKQTALTIHTIGKALAIMSDAKFGTDIASAYALSEKKREKEYHGDTSLPISHGIQTIQSVVNLTGEQVDLGYLAAFNSVAALNARTLRVEDILWNIRFMEYAKGEQPELSGSGDGTSQDISPKYYGAAVSFDNRDMMFSPYKVNNMLSAFRIKAEQILSHVAYKKIFMFDSAQVNTSLISKYASTGNDDAMTVRWRAAANARHTLNEATADMIDQANLVSAGNKKSQNTTEAALNIPSSTPIIVYYNHRHAELLNDVMMLPNNYTSVPNTSLLYNFVFQSTTKAPLSGAWKDDNTAIRDDFGTFGTVKEYATKDHKGVKIVIGGYRNINATFETLNIVQENRITERDMIISARQMNAFEIDNRQAGRVVLQ